MTNLLKSNYIPKISIIMGIYNCADTLAEAIDSIIAQSYKNWELILCDDCSTDNTFKIAEEYQKKYPSQIILIQNDKNSQLAYSLNHCLKYATGDLIARMDGDDVSLPNRFSTQVEYLQNNKDIDLVGTWMQRFEGNINNKSMILKQPVCPDKYSLRYGPCFNHATIMARKNVFDQLKGYTVSKRTIRGQDIDLWFRFFHKDFKGDNIQEVLYLVRENVGAIKRRRFKYRWLTFQTLIYGYNLLKFPKCWLVIEFIKTIIKSITPVWIITLYQKIETKLTNSKQ